MTDWGAFYPWFSPSLASQSGTAALCQCACGWLWRLREMPLVGEGCGSILCQSISKPQLSNFSFLRPLLGFTCPSTPPFPVTITSLTRTQADNRASCQGQIQPSACHIWGPTKASVIRAPKTHSSINIYFSGWNIIRIQLYKNNHC